jgi:NitT/TauT family transport system ATP-binding protein
MARNTKKLPILELKNVHYNIQSDSGQKKHILKDINIVLHEGECIGITGKSGIGKTTLLKIIAGLKKQTKGCVIGFSKTPRITIVFEDPCLFPWLTVKENIQLGLRSQYLTEKEEEDKIEEIIDIIGLSDYTHSYPKELSGGMKQRVNFARALVSEPDILLMDDPFSTLDILTAESLRSDLFDLLNQNIIKVKGIIMVTHNIHDVVKLCSSVMIIKNAPAEIYSEIKIDLPFPRNETSKKYHKILGQIYNDLSERNIYSADGKRINIYEKYLGLADVLPDSLQTFLDILSKKHDKRSDIDSILDEIKISEIDLLKILELAEMLNFIKIKNGQITMTAFGKALSVDTHQETQAILFGKQLLKEVPIIKHLQHSHGLTQLKSTLSKRLSKKKSEETAKVLVSWAKFGKII